MQIKNIVFDIGNVLLTWDPQKIIIDFLPEFPDPQALAKEIFKSETWMDLNRGLITEREAILIYHKNVPWLQLSQLEDLMARVKESLTPIDGSLELLNTIYESGIPIYSITDNVKEIVTYLKVKYDFWEKFTGVVVSADIGYLKPAQEIYQHLLQSHQLTPAETLFIDDILPNVEGAQRTGIRAFQFIDAKSCESALKNEWQLKF